MKLLSVLGLWVAACVVGGMVVAYGQAQKPPPLVDNENLPVRVQNLESDVYSLKERMSRCEAVEEHR